MRRITGATLLEQAKLHSHLLKHSPERSLLHHAEEIAGFLRLLHERVEVTHSVVPEFRSGRFPEPESLLVPGGPEELRARVVRSKQRVTSLLEALVERKIKFALKPE